MRQVIRSLIEQILVKLLVDPLLSSIKMSVFIGIVGGFLSWFWGMPWEVAVIFALAVIDLAILGVFHVAHNVKPDPQERALTPIQKRAISDSLMAYRGRAVEVHTWNSVRDSVFMAGQLSEVLEKGKWFPNIITFHGSLEAEHEFGIWICGNKRGADNDQPSTMDILKEAFDKAKVRYKTDVNEDGFVRLIVGHKDP